MNRSALLLFFLYVTSFWLNGQEISPPVDRWGKQFDTTYYRDLGAADSIINKALTYARETNKFIDLGHAAYRKGIVFDIRGETDSAAFYLFQGVDFLKKTDDWQALSSAYNNLGVLFFNIRDYEKVLEIGAKEIELYEKHDEQADLAYSLNNMSLALNYLDRFEEALEAQLKSYELFEELQDTAGMQSSLANIGNSYYKRKMYPEAIQYYEKAEKLLRVVNNVSNKITFYNTMANLYVEKGEFEKSLDYLNKSLALAEDYGSVERVQYIHEIFADVYEKKGDFQNALASYKLFKELRDKIFTDERNQAMAEFERKFELFELREEQERNHLKIIQQQRYIIYSIVGIIVLIVLAILILYAYQLRKKTIQLTQERLEEKTLMVKEMHHRVKNNLQLVGSMINIQAREMSEDNQERLSQVTASIHSMSTIHESLYTAKDWEWVDVKSFCEKLRVQMENSAGNEVAVSFSCDELFLDLDSTISLGIIINELFINSLKHAFQQNGKVRVVLKKEKDQLYLRYEDNGKGLPEGYSFENGNFGTKMIRSVMRKLKAEVQFETLKNGATFDFKITRYKEKPTEAKV